MPRRGEQHAPPHRRRRDPGTGFLASCYRNALTLADQHELRSVAFPALSTGASGYPMEAAALVALTTVAETAPTLATVKLVRRVGLRVRL